ncbi:unnamed protein product [Moneuplotes crassus]|uniref:Uncharacterized protein n=1 Tax=Euplotes crassus TaxID=5936 RepID=A0AAD2D7X7_EUPCR|nr:unnamed protein product [Moneuplotes crassus]
MNTSQDFLQNFNLDFYNLRQDNMWSGCDRDFNNKKDMNSLSIFQELDCSSFLPEAFEIELEKHSDKERSSQIGQDHDCISPLDPYADEDNLLFEYKDTQECTSSSKINSKSCKFADPPALSPPTDSENKSSPPVGNTRWGKQDDKRLFKILREMEVQHELSVSEILVGNNSFQNESEITLEDLCEKVGWISKPKKLLARIRTFWDKDFSFREVKVLKKILRKEFNYQNIDLERVNTYFPAKSLAKVANKVEELCQRFTQRRLSCY